MLTLCLPSKRETAGGAGGRVKREEDSSRDGENQGGRQRSVPDWSCWKKAESCIQHVNVSQE